MSSSGSSKGGVPSAKKKKLPAGWIVKESRKHKGKFYYFNVDTGESSWFAPTKGQTKKPNETSCVGKAHNTRSKQSSTSADKKNVESTNRTSSRTSQCMRDNKDKKDIRYQRLDAAIRSVLPTRKQPLVSGRKQLSSEPSQPPCYPATSSTGQTRAVKRHSKGNPEREFTLQPRKKCFRGETHQLQSHFKTIGEQFEETQLKRKQGKKSVMKTEAASRDQEQLKETPSKRKLDKTSGIKTESVSVSQVRLGKIGEQFGGTRSKGKLEKKSGIKTESRSLDQGRKDKIGNELETTRSKRKLQKTREIKTESRVADQVPVGAKCTGPKTSRPTAGKPSQIIDGKEMRKEETRPSSVVPPKRQVSMVSILYDEEDETVLEDSYVPTDVEMEDVEADEVKDQLLQIRDRIGSATTQLDSKVESHLPATSSSSPDVKDGLFIVLDTNVLISHLTFLEELRDQSIRGIGKPILVVPWVVLQELDGLKTDHSWKGKSKSKVSKQAIAAGKFIHTCIKSQHPRVQCQTPQSALKSEGIPVECNDDRVLQCCLQYQQKGNGMAVVLFSNDVNLCTKTMVSGVDAFTKQDLLLGLNRLSTSKRNKAAVTIKTAVDEVSSSTNKPIQVQSATQPTKNTELQPKVSDVKPPQQEHDLADDILCEMKKCLTEALSAALEREMTSAYDEQWIHIVIKKPPWTFQDLLRCYDKHWIAVFGMFLNKVDQSYFQEIKEHFTSSKGYGMSVEEVSHLLYSSHELTRHLHMHDKENDVLKHRVNTISMLLEKCNKHRLKNDAGSLSSTSITSTTSKQQTTASQITPPRMTHPISTQGISTPRTSTPIRQATTPSNQITVAQQQQVDEIKQRTSVEQKSANEINTSCEILSIINDDGDVEMVSEESFVPTMLSDSDVTASVMQVFQAVGETVFEKSASLMQAAAENSQLSTCESHKDRYIIERSLLFLCILLLPIIIAMAKLLQCTTIDESDSDYGICDALDAFTRECNISPMGSGLQPSIFRQFMSTESNKQTLGNGLKQFAEKLQELQEYIKHVDSDFYMRCQQTLFALANHTFC